MSIPVKGMVFLTWRVCFLISCYSSISFHCLIGHFFVFIPSFQTCSRLCLELSMGYLLACWVPLPIYNENMWVSLGVFCFQCCIYGVGIFTFFLETLLWLKFIHSAFTSDQSEWVGSMPSSPFSWINFTFSLPSSQLSKVRHHCANLILLPV